MIDEVITDAEERMKAAVASARRDFAGIRSARASTSLLDRVNVDYYGTSTPLNQMATLSAPEPRLLLIQPWDKSQMQAVEKAIMQSDLGLTPTSDGSVIRIAIPPLTEERRKELVRLVRKEAEEKRVAVRNVRRDANETIKELEKEKEISEDDGKRAQERIQALTNTYVQEIDRLLEAKEKEILEV